MSAMPMSPTTIDPKQIAREGYDAFNNDDFDTILTMLTDDVEIINSAFGINMQGTEAFVQVLRMLKAPWPDLTVTVAYQFAGEDFVVSECTLRGTNTGPIINPDGSQIPPTGKSFENVFCEVWRIRDNKICSLHNYGDNMGLFQQLGLIPDTTA